MSIGRSPGPFTRSPKPRLRSLHVNRALLARLRTVAKRTIEVIRVNRALAAPESQRAGA